MGSNYARFKSVVLLTSHIGIQKTWIPTAVVPRIEALALPISLEQQREAHAEYKHSLCYFLVKVRAYAYVYTQKMYHNKHKRDNLYPVGHLSLLSSETNGNLRDFDSSEQSVNKRLLNMSATLRQRCQTSLGAGSRCKGNTFF